MSLRQLLQAVLVISVAFALMAMLNRLDRFGQASMIGQLDGKGPIMWLHKSHDGKEAILKGVDKSDEAGRILMIDGTMYEIVSRRQCGESYTVYLKRGENK